MSGPRPSLKESTGPWFAFGAIGLVVLLLAFAFSRALPWAVATPLAVVLGTGLVAFVHASQGGGRSLVEIGCSGLIVAGLLAVVIPVFGRVREKAKGTACADNLRRIGQGFALYANDADGRIPPIEGWSERLASRVPAPRKGRRFAAGPFECASRPGAFGYALDASVAGRRLADLSGPVAFDSTRGERDEIAYGIALPPRHPGERGLGANILEADGRVRWQLGTPGSDR